MKHLDVTSGSWQGINYFNETVSEREGEIQQKSPHTSPLYSSPGEVPILGGGILGKLRTEVAKSSMTSSNLGGGGRGHFWEART